MKNNSFLMWVHFRYLCSKTPTINFLTLQASTSYDSISISYPYALLYWEVLLSIFLRSLHAKLHFLFLDPFHSSLELSNTYDTIIFSDVILWLNWRRFRIKIFLWNWNFIFLGIFGVVALNRIMMTIFLLRGCLRVVVVVFQNVFRS
jgi:hypothetical protein